MAVDDSMYRRSKFLEVLIAIREQMAREADYDVDLFAEMVRNGKSNSGGTKYSLNGSESNAKKPAKKKRLKK